MAQQDGTHRLCGAVQLDDAYLGGERAGGKAWRGSENKVPFVAAVSVNGKGHPLYVKLNLVSGFTSKDIGKWAQAARVNVVVARVMQLFAEYVERRRPC